MSPTSKVFLSHTSELADYPADRSFVDAALDAVRQAGCVGDDMRDFPAVSKSPARLDEERLLACDVYVGIFGFQFGTPVHERPEVSYTQLEFLTAQEAGKPQLIFLLDENAECVGLPGSVFRGGEHGERQETFRQSVLNDDYGLTCQFFSTPDELQRLLAEALRNLRRPDRENWTRQVNEALARQAQRTLDETCQPYVASSLSPEGTKRKGLTETSGKRERVQLKDRELKRVVHGRLAKDRNRVRLFADSGMGKTTLLLHCEQQIAAAQDGRLPLRVDRLSEFQWRESPNSVLRNLFEKQLARYLPDDVATDDGLTWFQSLIKHGKVVFLLDALDQARDKLDGLSTFLRSARVANCPVLMTGRPETKRTRSGVWRDASWDTLCVDPFDEPRQREFLGSLADDLLPSSDESCLSATHRRKEQWADLLNVPLLLRLMRDLAASGELEGLSNRLEVYQRAIDGLIEKGLQTLEATEHRGDIWDATEVKSILEAVAWGWFATQTSAQSPPAPNCGSSSTRHT